MPAVVLQKRQKCDEQLPEHCLFLYRGPLTHVREIVEMFESTEIGQSIESIVYSLFCRILAVALFFVVCMLDKVDGPVLCVSHHAFEKLVEYIDRHCLVNIDVRELPCKIVNWMNIVCIVTRSFLSNLLCNLLFS